MLYRTGFTTDLSELDIIHGGEKKLYRAIKEIVAAPPAAGRVRLRHLRHRR